MRDYSELKRLAEAATAGPWVSGGNWVSTVRGNSVADCPRGDEDFIAAANPVAVLALIAENKRLATSDQEATELCDCLSVLLGGIAVAVRGAEEPKTRHGFSDLPSRVKTVVSERDQLKAENEVLRVALESCADELEGQVIQCYHGQPVEDMHPVTRRSYERDMACVTEARAAMSKEG